MTIKEIINLLEIERFKMCLNQYKFPYVLGISRFTYMNNLHGRVQPQFQTLAKMVKFLNERGHDITFDQIDKPINDK